MIIIGIDPGTTTVGYGIIKKQGNKKELLDYGIIKTIPKISINEKILEISKGIDYFFEKYKPKKVVIEKIYFTKNLKTGIDVSQVRGVLLYKVLSKNIELVEYTPLELKSAICGNGKATKRQLQNAIKIFFDLDEIPKPDDAADAIGLAYMGFLKNN